MISQDLKQFNLPDGPGVYFFKQGKSILYVGKATSLHDRVRSYFNKDLIESRGPRLVAMLELADSIDFIQTDSVLEALILEAREIKKYQPKYNTREKDNKSFYQVIITKEDYPRVLMIRERELEVKPDLAGSIKYKFGPFPYPSELREALRIVRKIFTYRDKCSPLSGRACFNVQIGLCRVFVPGR